MQEQSTAKGVHGKISQVMKEVEYLAKDMGVSYAGSSYKAISEEKVTTAVRAAMVKVGLVMYPIRQNVTVITRGPKNGKDRDDIIQVEITYQICDTESGDSVDVVSFGHGIDSQDKSPGKAMTYAFKYALLRTFAIPTGDDPDKTHSNEIDNAQPAKTPSKTPSKSGDELESAFQLIAANKDKLKPEIGKIMNQALEHRTKKNLKGLQQIIKEFNIA